MTEETTTFLDRTVGRLAVVWRDIADGTRRALGEGLRPDLPDEDASRFRRRIAECLDGRGGGSRGCGGVGRGESQEW